MAPKEPIRLPLRWQFIPVTDPRDGAIRWEWRASTQAGKLALRSEASFETLTECIADAKKQGFSEP
jgi:hypothetical protein